MIKVILIVIVSICMIENFIFSMAATSEYEKSQMKRFILVAIFCFIQALLNFGFICVIIKLL